MSETLKRLCAWSGPATVAVALVGWLIAGVLPLPLGSSSTTDEVVAFYGHDTRVLIGLVIAQLGVCLVFPLIALITLAMLRIEGRTPPLLTIIQAVTGAATGVLLLMPMLLMAVIAFRPDRTPPELTVTLNDIAWLLFLTPIAPFMIQNIAIGTAILGGTSGPCYRGGSATSTSGSPPRSSPPMCWPSSFTTAPSRGVGYSCSGWLCSPTPRSSS